MQLSNVVAVVVPRWLTETVHNLTGVPINHYARIDFNHVASMVDALGGVSVTLPGTTRASATSSRRASTRSTHRGAEVRAPALAEPDGPGAAPGKPPACRSRQAGRQAPPHQPAEDDPRAERAYQHAYRGRHLHQLAGTEPGDRSRRPVKQREHVSSPRRRKRSTTPSCSSRQSSALWSAISKDSIPSFARSTRPPSLRPRHSVAAGCGPGRQRCRVHQRKALGLTGAAARTGRC